ncbi:hypothetical protein AUJ17_05455 [Candidatus Micrarchaeota archaeon CG1_02_47_40]|nr:MAG: hypothetical protein AUJ17_05455 [Candidatus Micrarchaeota archaeon CG1_02_47_40]
MHSVRKELGVVMAFASSLYIRQPYCGMFLEPFRIIHDNIFFQKVFKVIIFDNFNAHLKEEFILGFVRKSDQKHSIPAQTSNKKAKKNILVNKERAKNAYFCSEIRPKRVNFSSNSEQTHLTKLFCAGTIFAKNRSARKQALAVNP